MSFGEGKDNLAMSGEQDSLTTDQSQLASRVSQTSPCFIPLLLLRACEFPLAEHLDPVFFQAGPGASWANVALEGDTRCL